jgi:hypothetical protein
LFEFAWAEEECKLLLFLNCFLFIIRIIK